MRSRILLFALTIILCTTTLLAKTTYISYSDEIKLVNQMNTGQYSYNNCGAASLEMVFDYLNVDMGTASEIRNQVKPYDGWLYTNEIEEFLDYNKIPYEIESIFDEEDILNALDKGVLMMCLDASKISNKTYTGISGHFVVLSGYYQKDEDCYLEVFDPMSYETKYYKTNEVLLSAMSWWEYFFVFKREAISDE